MPEYPDVELYREHILRRTRGKVLERIQLLSPFVLRSVEPSADLFVGRKLTELRRLGKRLALGFDGGLFAVIHLMIAGRLHWRDVGAKLNRRRTLCAFHFEHGLLELTEAGTKKRASLHLVGDEAGLDEHQRGGLEVFEISADEFVSALRERNHTLKRSLTDPRIFSGIGNAYSDEILYRAKLSPAKMSPKLDDEEAQRLFTVTREVLSEWLERLRAKSGDKFPEKVTAFHPEMAVHGKFGKPCPECGDPVQKIAYATRETNYCASCQTDGKLLADRGLSRLLKRDWPRSLEELENYKAERRR